MGWLVTVRWAQHVFPDFLLHRWQWPGSPGLMDYPGVAVPITFLATFLLQSVGQALSSDFNQKQVLNFTYFLFKFLWFKCLLNKFSVLTQYSNFCRRPIGCFLLTSLWLAPSHRGRFMVSAGSDIHYASMASTDGPFRPLTKNSFTRGAIKALIVRYAMVKGHKGVLIKVGVIGSHTDCI